MKKYDKSFHRVNNTERGGGGERERDAILKIFKNCADPLVIVQIVRIDQKIRLSSLPLDIYANQTNN